MPIATLSPARAVRATAVITLALVASLAAQGGGAEGDRSDELRRAIVGGHARNIFLFIGDGMGDSEITLARNYAVGPGGRLAMDRLPFTGSYTTYSVREDDPSLPEYVPDSAATATAWATGQKTSNGRIATSPGDGRALPTILEIAQERGYRTGDVTTAELTDATPAALGSHVTHRSCEGPADMKECPKDLKSAGGRGSIAEQLIAHKIDVLLGGGYDRFDQRTEAGRLVVQEAVAAGYRVVSAATGLEYAASGHRLLGLFAPVNMTTEWTGPEATPYPSNVKAPQACKQDHRPAAEPSLAEMATKAIELLDRPADAGPGFFLQVEGASIDKQDHAANPCGQIGETVAFDRAIRVGLDFAAAHPDTLIVVTADHAHASQIVPLPTDADHPSGLVAVLMTPMNVPMAVSYATNAYHRSQEHTGTQVHIAGQGPQAANIVGVTDQTDLFRLLERALLPASPGAAHAASHTN